MNIRGILFALGGVLVSTDELHRLARKQVAERLGVPVRAAEPSVGAAGDSFVLAGAGFSETERAVLAEEEDTAYHNLLSSLTEADVPAHIRSLLKELRRRGYKIAACSTDKNARYILQRVGLYSCFDAISDGCNIVRGKPDPELFYRAAEYLCLSPSACLVVEDSPAGIAAACAGGFASAGLGAARSCGGCTFRLEKLAELQKILPCLRAEIPLR